MTRPSKKSVPASIDQVLQGRAAGVQIQANSGTPGASTSIRIRGIQLTERHQPAYLRDRRRSGGLCY